MESSAITNRLRALEVEDWIVRRIEAMLHSRIIDSHLGAGRVERQATRGTPQGGVISPLLWLLVLSSPAARAIRMVAYADDIALLVSEKFSSTLSEILESALRDLEGRADRNGLRINPSKAELVLFSRRRKVDNFRRPKVGGIALSLSTEVKYLGIILDSKLDRRRNTEVRTRTYGGLVWGRVVGTKRNL